MVNKHKKLKLVDPECRREPAKLPKSDGFNCAPVDVEKQDVPKKMMEFIDLKNNHLKNLIKKNKKKKHHGSLVVHKPYIGEELPGMTKPVQKIPEVMAQRDSESISHFLGRIQDLANKYNSEAKIEDKFGIGEPNFGFGKIQRGSRKKEKRKLFKNKQKEKKRRKHAEEEIFSLKKEHIPFGETAMAPPDLIGLKKGKDKMDKPGMRNLLLKSNYLSGSDKGSGSMKTIKLKKEEKRKTELEAERLKAVQLYRLMKAKKQAKLAKLQVF